MKTKEPKKPVHYIKHGRVGFRYMVGISLIAIETDPDNNWPEMPDYYRVRFAIEVPKGSPHVFITPEQADGRATFIGEAHKATGEQIKDAVIKAIKAKINEQRKAHGATVETGRPLGSDPDQQEQKATTTRHKGKRRKPATAILPFESNTIADEGKTAI